MTDGRTPDRVHRRGSLRIQGLLGTPESIQMGKNRSVGFEETSEAALDAEDHQRRHPVPIRCSKHGMGWSGFLS
ncbi:unnamed protein product [Darwinula stevensoni]|uniref:Uncharacterized protein n=1 Tax=Darwinula stevensoni TaxID=69355 RepID=A0A7R9AE18_9CRUS|nr:unnamed protein product [Darwinula stevensoni]CAG0901884.1 unnamed protein product [Darwinula stevensoni]